MFGRMTADRILSVKRGCDPLSAVRALVETAEEAKVMKWIEFPASILVFLIIPGDVTSVAQYVASMKPQPAAATLTGGNAAAGEAKYTAVCTVCHGADAMGQEAMMAPTLLNQADWYMLHQLEKFKTGMRGADTADVSGQQMAAMSAMLEDHQAMLDVLAYIHTLRK